MEDKGIDYKGHIIKKEPHYQNAYIHWKYTITGPLFPEPLEKLNLAEAKIEISDRIHNNPEWYQHYLISKRFKKRK